MKLRQEAAQQLELYLRILNFQQVMFTLPEKLQTMKLIFFLEKQKLYHFNV